MIPSAPGAPRIPSGARARGGPAVAALGALILLAVGVVACRSQPAPDVGAGTVTALASAEPEPEPEAEPEPEPAGTAAVPVRDGALPAPDADQPPVRLRIPDLGLTATVAAVGVDARTGEFDVPPSVDRVGWYRYGPGATARAGSIVVAGHVDSAEQGKGAFFRLGSLEPGADVTLTGADGTQRRFTVVARERYAKTRIPLDRYFSRDGAPRLTLITCGGPFDAKTRHYRDNVVVTATPG